MNLKIAQPEAIAKKQKIASRLIHWRFLLLIIGIAPVLVYLVFVFDGEAVTKPDIKVLFIGLGILGLSSFLQTRANLIMGLPWHGRVRHPTAEEIRAQNEYLYKLLKELNRRDSSQ